MSQIDKIVRNFTDAELATEIKAYENEGPEYMAYLERTNQLQGYNRLIAERTRREKKNAKSSK